MKNARALALLFLLSVFLCGTAQATTSTINPNVPANGAPLASSTIRALAQAAYNDINNIYSKIAALAGIGANQVVGAISAGTPIPLGVPSCSGASNALIWTTGVGFGCQTISAGGSSVFSALTAAAGINTIDNTGFAQTWNWSSLGSSSGLSITGAATTSGKALSVTAAGSSNSGYAGYFTNTSASGFAVYVNGVEGFSGSSSGTTTLAAAAAASGALTLPAATDTLVGRSTTDTLTNKTLSGAANTLSNIGNGSLSNSTITLSPGVGMSGGGSTALGGTTTFSALKASTTQFGVAECDGSTISCSAGVFTAIGASVVGGPMIRADSAYTADTAGNLFPYLYTGGGSNAAPSDWSWGVAATLGSDVVLQLRFPMPTRIPSGTFKLFSWCKANATTGAALYTASDAFVAAGTSESNVTLTSDTQVTVSPTAVDIPILSRTTLSATPVADGYEVVAVTFNHTSWTLAQILACRFMVGWE